MTSRSVAVDTIHPSRARLQRPALGRPRERAPEGCRAYSVDGTMSNVVIRAGPTWVESHAACGASSCECPTCESAASLVERGRGLSGGRGFGRLLR